MLRDCALRAGAQIAHHGPASHDDDAVKGRIYVCSRAYPPKLRLRANEVGSIYDLRAVLSPAYAALDCSIS